MGSKDNMSSDEDAVEDADDDDNWITEHKYEDEEETPQPASAALPLRSRGTTYSSYVSAMGPSAHIRTNAKHHLGSDFDFYSYVCVYRAVMQCNI